MDKIRFRLIIVWLVGFFICSFQGVVMAAPISSCDSKSIESVQQELKNANRRYSAALSDYKRAERAVYNARENSIRVEKHKNSMRTKFQKLSVEHARAVARAELYLRLNKVKRNRNSESRARQAWVEANAVGEKKRAVEDQIRKAILAVDNAKRRSVEAKKHLVKVRDARNAAKKTLQQINQCYMRKRANSIVYICQIDPSQCEEESASQ